MFILPLVLKMALIQESSRITVILSHFKMTTLPSLHSRSLVLTRVAGLLRTGIPEGAGLVARIADEDHGDDEDQRANCARFSLQEESREIEDDEHDVVVEQRGVDRLGQQQHWY